MNALDALTLMHDEDNRILQIRNIRYNITLIYDDIMAGRQEVNIPFHALIDDEWEIGVVCEACDGGGEISVECACNGRSLHSLLENPCCGGWNTATCGECEGTGIRWKREV